MRYCVLKAISEEDIFFFFFFLKFKKYTNRREDENCLPSQAVFNVIQIKYMYCTTNLGPYADNFMIAE